MKAIGYVRTSNDSRDSFGIDVQRDAVERFARENNIELVRIFSENGVSGALENRPALGEMFEYVKTNEVGQVVFPRLDRLARDLIVQENLLSEFQKLGVRPVSIDEPDLLSFEPSRVMFRQMKGAMAQYEKSMITLRLSGGRRKKVELGKGYAGGNLPFGFRFENGKYVPVDAEVEALKELFRLRRKPRNGQRVSFRKIAVVLNEKFWHLRTFSEAGVFYMANNPFYKGIQQYSSVRYVHETLSEVFS